MVLARKFALVGFAAILMLFALLTVPAAAQDDDCYPVPPGGCVTATPTPTPTPTPTTDVEVDCPSILADPSLGPDDLPDECIEDCEELAQEAAAANDPSLLPAVCSAHALVLSDTGFPTGTIVVAMAILFGFGLPMLLLRRRTT